MAEPKPIRFTVAPGEDGERLDKLVAHGAGVSRKQARLWIRGGLVRVAGKVLRILSRQVRAGRPIEIQLEASSSSSGAGAAPAGHAAPAPAGHAAPAPAGHAAPAPATPRLLFRDRDLALIEKPAGLLSEGEGSQPSLEKLLPRLLGAARGQRVPRLVHRLDAPTSGVMVVARTARAAKRLGEAFRRGAVKKDYLALCAGELSGKREVNQPIGRGSGRRWEVRRDGKPSATSVAPLAAGGGHCLVHAQPRTGRTHQIRVHLAHLGHPLCGDGLYGGPRYTEENPPRAIPHTLLHAVRLRFEHPVSGEPMVQTCAPPAEFVAWAEALGLGEPLRAFWQRLVAGEE